ncbi:hypothetical protein EL753P1_00050 [Eggerthella phage EL753P1]|jgi:hypothetical protein|nr:hypothetical protein EL753P1_00050 [Eggerthella phage EL753P1]
MGNANGTLGVCDAVRLAVGTRGSFDPSRLREYSDMVGMLLMQPDGELRLLGMTADIQSSQWLVDWIEPSRGSCTVQVVCLRSGKIEVR